MKDIENKTEASKLISMKSSNYKAGEKSRKSLVVQRKKAAKKIVPTTPIPEEFKPTTGITAKKSKIQLIFLRIKMVICLLDGGTFLSGYHQQ